MSNKAAMLAYSEYFLGHPRPYLTEDRDAKGAYAFIGGTSAGDISIWGIPVDDIFSVCAELFSKRCSGC